MLFYPFLGEGSPTKIDYRKKMVPTLEDLDTVAAFLGALRAFPGTDMNEIPHKSCEAPAHSSKRWALCRWSGTSALD